MWSGSGDDQQRGSAPGWPPLRAIRLWRSKTAATTAWVPLCVHPDLSITGKGRRRTGRLREVDLLQYGLETRVSPDASESRVQPPLLEGEIMPLDSEIQQAKALV
jgi:hypothetical protein